MKDIKEAIVAEWIIREIDWKTE